MPDYSYFRSIYLAKNHFSLHAVDQNGKVILHKSVTRSKLLTTIANMPLIGVTPITGESSRYKVNERSKAVECKYAQCYIWQ